MSDHLPLPGSSLENLTYSRSESPRPALPLANSISLAPDQTGIGALWARGATAIVLVGLPLLALFIPLDALCGKPTDDKAADDDHDKREHDGDNDDLDERTSVHDNLR